MHPTSTLICIPDISGFTEFMGEANFELSSKVIPSLLNNIIYSNEIGLKVSEVEGDAVLFYKRGELPTLRNLVGQCRFFYTEFYKQLAVLRRRYSKMEDAVHIPKMLGLKIILHYGEEVGLTKVGKHIKLFGEDLIVAHRLLKNDVPVDEYLLLSDSLVNYYNKEGVIDREFEWGNLTRHETDYPQLGKLTYWYIDFRPLIEN
ncbi:DUF2652 domain-containing protein [Ulvibacterium sp.]|uniref:DUF2652 domain-containing protein n=1 Tax=Ulvibacterium sp. TaxID=2665914 RepID=UPI003BA87BE5